MHVFVNRQGVDEVQARAVVDNAKLAYHQLVDALEKHAAAQGNQQELKDWRRCYSLHAHVADQAKSAFCWSQDTQRQIRGEMAQLVKRLNALQNMCDDLQEVDARLDTTLDQYWKACKDAAPAEDSGDEPRDPMLAYWSQKSE